MLSNITGTWMTDEEATDPATLGTADPLHRPVRRRTRPTARRPEPGARRGGARRHADRVGGAPPAVVGTTPRGSADAPPGPEPQMTTTRSCSAWDSCGRPVSTWTGTSPATGRRPVRAGDAARLRLCAAAPLGRAQRQRRVAGRRSAAPTGVSAAAAPPSPAPATAGGKSQMQATLLRIWSQCLGVRHRPQRQLLRTRRRLADRDQRRDDRGSPRARPDPAGSLREPDACRTGQDAVARYAEGGLARQSLDDAINPPLPPNMAYFLEHGLRDVGRWRTPVILHLRSDISARRRPGGADRGHRRPRRAAGAARGAGGHLGAAHRRRRRVHRTADRAAARRCRDRAARRNARRCMRSSTSSCGSTRSWCRWRRRSSGAHPAVRRISRSACTGSRATTSPATCC